MTLYCVQAIDRHEAKIGPAQTFDDCAVVLTYGDLDYSVDQVKAKLAEVMAAHKILVIYTHRSDYAVLLASAVSSTSLLVRYVSASTLSFAELVAHDVALLRHSFDTSLSPRWTPPAAVSPAPHVVAVRVFRSLAAAEEAGGIGGIDLLVSNAERRHHLIVVYLHKDQTDVPSLPYSPNLVVRTVDALASAYDASIDQDLEVLRRQESWGVLLDIPRGGSNA